MATFLQSSSSMLPSWISMMSIISFIISTLDQEIYVQGYCGYGEVDDCDFRDADDCGFGEADDCGFGEVEESSDVITFLVKITRWKISLQQI